jgi:F-type H+-transporting ATPase subunit a
MATAATLALFFAAGRKRALVPAGVQNIAEMSVDFIREGVVEQAMGHGKAERKWTSYLTCLFFFILFTNVTGIIPFLQMPGNARIAIPLFLALITYVAFIFEGFRHNGFGYLKAALVPPNVPLGMLFLVVPIEIISTFVIRPFSLFIRLFANMLAGHLLLVTFSVMGHALLFAETSQFVLKPMTILPFAMFIAITLFEVLVIFLQAYIFTILTAVYIGGAIHPDH